MKKIAWFATVATLVLGTTPSPAQSHHSNWLYRNMTDTTFVMCWNDSLTHIGFPPGCMSMMMPDSMYCRVDFMPMDSLHHPHDSTMIGWCRVMLGTDSIHFTIMNCDSMGGNHRMQFMRGLQCRMHWDSLQCDSLWRHWHPTGIRGWDGTSWVGIPGASFDGNVAIFSTTQLYSAFGFTGIPSNPTSVGASTEIPSTYALNQNYPNPFNPATTISFSIPSSSKVTLKVFDLLGREVATLVDGDLAAGMHAVVWDGKAYDARAASSSIYFCRMSATPSAGGETVKQVRKMILMK